MAKCKIGIKIVILTVAALLFLTSCNTEKEPLDWGMYESQVRYIENIPNDNKETTVGNYSWITCDNQELFGLVGKLTYNFDAMQLTDIGFIPSQINNVDEMNKIYDTLKENVSLEYGDPTIDEIREGENSGLQYHYAEWNVENTLIMLQDNENALQVSLSFHSTEYLKTFEQSEQSQVNTATRYKTKGEWALSTPYVFAVENDTYSGDIYCAGEYTFKVTNTTIGEAPMYDIYIEKSEYDSMSELGEIDYTVGGAGSFPINITLNKGDYVYVVPYSDLLYEPKGYLSFEIKG